MPYIEDGNMHLMEMKEEGDKVIFVHGQNFEAVARQCAEERKNDDVHNLSMRGRTFEKIATIPGIFFEDNKDLMYDQKAMKRFLMNEGSIFRTSRRKI